MKHPLRLLRSNLPVFLRRTIRRTGEFFGKGLDLEVALRRLHSLGFEPRFCVDIGAYEGEWAQMCRAEFPLAGVLMVEAQESKRAALQKLVATSPAGAYSLAMSLLGAEDGRTVHFNEMETGSSVFAETSHFERAVVEKKTARLDTILAQGGYPQVDFLKLDVQGYELEILKGAPETLKQATAVLLEASLLPVNAGCPLLPEVVAFMTATGFRLFDFCSQLRRSDGVLWQTDLLFLRADASILPQAALTRETWQ